MARKDYAAEKGKHLALMVRTLQQQVSLAFNLGLRLSKPSIKAQANTY